MAQKQVIGVQGIASTFSVGGDHKPTQAEAAHEIAAAEERTVKLKAKRDRILQDIDQQLEYNVAVIEYHKQFV